MIRKLYAWLVVTVVAVTMVAVPVMASGSPSTSTTETTTTETTTADSPVITTTTSTVVVDETAPASAVSVSVEGSNVAVLTTELKSSVAVATSNTEVLSTLGVSTGAKLASSFDLTYSGTIPEGGVQIPITVITGNVGDYAYILHYNLAGQWEKVGEGVLGADRTVVGTFTSFSPVAIMLVDTASVTSTVTAPKTGN
ncbi:MAG: hypothetical protein R3Y67_06725 [Eubacteriales bacterium]